MRALLDTDVVLDLFLDRAEFAEAAAAIWEAIERGECEGYISALTPVNVFYVARKLKGITLARQAVAELLAALMICTLDEAALTIALGLPLADYEDAVQHASAQAADLDAIITRNLDDYQGATLPVLSPTEFLFKLRSP